MSRSSPFGLGKENDFSESTDKVREGLLDRWDTSESLRGISVTTV